MFKACSKFMNDFLQILFLCQFYTGSHPLLPTRVHHSSNSSLSYIINFYFCLGFFLITIQICCYLAHLENTYCQPYFPLHLLPILSFPFIATLKKVACIHGFQFLFYSLWNSLLQVADFYSSPDLNLMVTFSGEYSMGPDLISYFPTHYTPKAP